MWIYLLLHLLMHSLADSGLRPARGVEPATLGYGACALTAGAAWPGPRSVTCDSETC